MNLKQLICSGSIKNVILDTDAYNEVDDQFCLAYCMLSPERIKLLSVNAAPFLNERSVSAADGMEKSYNEIHKVIKLVDPHADIPVFRGCDNFMTSHSTVINSPAVDNIINTVQKSTETVFIVAIGALTNIAQALIKCPEIIGRCVLIWLGGHSLHSPDTHEFNLQGDLIATQTVFESGIQIVQVPCDGVCTEFVTTLPELEYYLRGKNALCDYLVDNVSSECAGHYGCSRIIWDVTAAAVLIRPQACHFAEIPKPIITSGYTYSFNISRPHYIYTRKVIRDDIYADMFRKLSNA